MTPLRTFMTGVQSIDYLIEGTMPGLFIQVVGGPDSSLTPVAMNFGYSAEHIVYVDVRGDMDPAAATEIMGPDTVVVGPREDGRYFDIIRELINGAKTDLVIIDSLHAISSPDEKHGAGSAASILMISKGLRSIRHACSTKGVTVVMVNHLSNQMDASGSRIYGGNVLTKQMAVTIGVAPRAKIGKGKKVVGQEYVMGVMHSKFQLAGRKVLVGLLGQGIIDEPYWLYKQGKRFGLLEETALGAIIYRKVTFRHKWLFMDNLATAYQERDHLFNGVWDGLRDGK